MYISKYFLTLYFKPGGFDVPSLLGTATGLIAGLLAGDENFGKVLGSYIGIAVDGFSGGGGAVKKKSSIHIGKN